MQNPFQANLRKLWLLLCTTTLVIYSIVPVTRETLLYWNAPSSVLEALMFLLSFPLGDALMFFFYSGSHGIMERFVFWALAMGIGYVQWFHLFPALIRRKQANATTLNLDAGSGVAFADKSPLGLNATQPLTLPETARPPVPQFNDRGLTPLERIFRGDEPEG